MVQPIAATPAVPSPPPSPPADGSKRERKDRQTLVPNETVIWEGTEWPCWPCCCMAPIFCSVTYWTVTSVRIDKKSGCCGTSEDTMDLRRITDLKYNAAPPPCCCCRGTVSVYAADNTDGQIDINTWGTRELYLGLKEAWSLAKAGVAVDTGGADGTV